MGFLTKFWNYSLDTYGGAPVLLVINLIQVALLAWVIVAGIRANRFRGSSEERRLAASSLAEIWQRRVRPLAMTLMLIGPGLGLGMSTLLGALGMGALGDAMGNQTSADALAAILAHSYREISYAYFLMVAGTFPMLLGPVIVLCARRIDEDGADARGGEPDDLMLHTLKSLLFVTEQNAARSQADAARLQALLEQALQRRAA
jgi:hypothetical protein